MNSKQVHVVILNWNKAELTLTCLDSLNLSKYRNFTVTLLDNGSSDNSMEEALRLKSYSYPIRLKKSQDNLGWSGGVNFVANDIQDESWAYLLLLNNDAVVFEDTISNLVATVTEEDVDILGGSSYHLDGKLIFAGHRWPQILFGFNRPYGFDSKSQTWPSDYAEGSCLILSKKVVKERLQDSGALFRKDYFMYCDDLEFGVWARSKGYRILISKISKIIHPGSESGGGPGNPIAYYYITRNRIALAQETLPIPWLILFHLWTIPSRVLLLIVHIFKGRWTILGPVFRGILDGYFNRTGRRHRSPPSLG